MRVCVRAGVGVGGCEREGVWGCLGVIDMIIFDNVCVLKLSGGHKLMM